MTDQDLHDLFNKYKDAFCTQYDLHDSLAWHLVRLELSNRMRTCGGYAIPSQRLVKLNRRLLIKHPKHIDQTIVHELAHLVNAYLFSGRGHDASWKRIMHEMGFKPDRCHKMDVSEYKVKHRVIAIGKCACRSHEFKARTFKRIRRGATYTCVNCKERIVIDDN